MENPIKMDDLGKPLFFETPIYTQSIYIILNTSSNLQPFSRLQSSWKLFTLGWSNQPPVWTMAWETPSFTIFFKEGFSPFLLMVADFQGESIQILFVSQRSLKEESLGTVD